MAKPRIRPGTSSIRRTQSQSQVSRSRQGKRSRPKSATQQAQVCSRQRLRTQTQAAPLAPHHRSRVRKGALPNGSPRGLKHAPCSAANSPLLRTLGRRTSGRTIRACRTRITQLSTDRPDRSQPFRMSQSRWSPCRVPRLLRPRHLAQTARAST